MDLKEAREAAAKLAVAELINIIVALDNRITELEIVLRGLLRVSGYNSSLQEYSKARESALRILAKGDGEDKQ